jgi:hypothetical protein
MPSGTLVDLMETSFIEDAPASQPDQDPEVDG